MRTRAFVYTLYNIDISDNRSYKTKLIRIYIVFFLIDTIVQTCLNKLKKID